MRDYKYLIAYLLPLSAFAGFYFRSWFSGGSVYLAFIIIPILEQFMPVRDTSFTKEEEVRRSRSRLFDVLLYLNVPILYALLGYYYFLMSEVPMRTTEMVGITINMGVVSGAMGINLAHELGHRRSAFEQMLARLMLWPSLYLHFTIEHNRGHHRYVGTLEDPATARKGETLYAFWGRSIGCSWLHAWKLEGDRLKQKGVSSWSLQNEMIRMEVGRLLYLVLVAWLFGPVVLAGILFSALLGILLLETVNYIEHYGLMRKKLPSGRYEPVEKCHSWNSNHELGRIFLYELTRHADHHFRSSRKYQVLRHFERSPQLPYGYPTSMLLALVPPFWFSLMNKRVEQWNAKRSGVKG